MVAPVLVSHCECQFAAQVRVTSLVQCGMPPPMRVAYRLSTRLIVFQSLVWLSRRRSMLGLLFRDDVGCTWGPVRCEWLEVTTSRRSICCLLIAVNVPCRLSALVIPQRQFVTESCVHKTFCLTAYACTAVICCLSWLWCVLSARWQRRCIIRNVHNLYPIRISHQRSTTERD